MMTQYQGIKENYKDAVLFFRLGDFYEMFNDDAREVSRLLNLTLTRRNGAPMCGIPYHASKIYIARLLRLGKKIAVCEQVSIPGPGKGIAERKVIEVITPGTTVEEDYLEQGLNNFLAALTVTDGPRGEKQAGFAYIDISTGEFRATHWPCEYTGMRIRNELGRVSPREMIFSQTARNIPAVSDILDEYPELVVNVYPDWHFGYDVSGKRLLEQFGTVNLKAYGLSDTSPEVPAAGFLLDYLTKNASSALPHITGIHVYEETEFVILDDSSRRNLELTVSLRDNSSSFTLFEVLNNTCTSMGNRLLRNWLLHPLTSAERIRERHTKVELLTASEKRLESLRATLSRILDVERLVSRIAMDRAHAKDLRALRASLLSYSTLKTQAEEAGYRFSPEVHSAGKDEALNAVVSLIGDAILDEPSIPLNEGHLIRPGWSEKLDRLHELKDNFTGVLEKYLEEEKEKTGIQSLKIRFNRLIGYYIEVSKGNLSAVPSHFIRRRSLANGDRYSTERLEELERELTGADQQIIEEERSLFLDVRDRLKNEIPLLLEISAQLGELDVFQSFALAALRWNWVCPDIDESGALDIADGRHPVVEYHLSAGEFVPNSLSLDTEHKTFALITGPNMAGKSTFLRQNALIVLMAQIGSFVPARKARIGLVDRIFCRVGAADNLARGESTFLVEMNETAHILRSATESSLVIMDEVGRGTSTEDGLSIAWAVSEYLLDDIRAKTLFATHYHEMSRLNHPALIPLFLEVLEAEGEVVFLKRVKEGASDNSYGIHVAKLAGIPEPVIVRAREILENLQQALFPGGSGPIPDKRYSDEPDTNALTGAVADEPASGVAGGTAESRDDTVPFTRTPAPPQLFSDEELVLDAILSSNTDNMIPLEALQKIAAWKKTLSQG